MTHRDRQQTHLEKERDKREREREGGRRGSIWKMVNITQRVIYLKLSIVRCIVMHVTNSSLIRGRQKNKMAR